MAWNYPHLHKYLAAVIVACIVIPALIDNIYVLAESDDLDGDAYRGVKVGAWGLAGVAIVGMGVNAYMHEWSLLPAVCGCIAAACVFGSFYMDQILNWYPDLSPDDTTRWIDVTLLSVAIIAAGCGLVANAMAGQSTASAGAYRPF